MKQKEELLGKWCHILGDNDSKPKSIVEDFTINTCWSPESPNTIEIWNKDKSAVLHVIMKKMSKIGVGFANAIVDNVKPDFEFNDSKRVDCRLPFMFMIRTRLCFKAENTENGTCNAKLYNLDGSFIKCKISKQRESDWINIVDSEKFIEKDRVNVNDVTTFIIDEETDYYITDWFNIDLQKFICKFEEVFKNVDKYMMEYM